MNNSNIDENFTKFDKSYVLCSTENYFEILTECVMSIREFSELPIIVYLINSDKQVEVPNTKTIRWDLQIDDLSDNLYLKNKNNFYIDRKNPTIYKILIQRPLITKDALSKYSNNVCYVDSDSIATPLVDTIFSYYEENSKFPYFVEGIYEFLKYEGRGGGGALGGGWSDTLEHNACELFNVDQTVRKYYRQTGYFVAGQNTYDFLDEWYWMCNHPKILNNISHYAPYDEETISNVLLWKYNIQEGLPYIYVNGSVETVSKMYNEVEYKGPGTFNFDGNWLRIPYYKEHLLFFHGEKNLKSMREMVKEIKKFNSPVPEVREYPNINPSQNWGDIITKFILEHFSGTKLNDEDVFHFDKKRKIPHKNGKIIGVGSTMLFTKPNDYVWGTGCIDKLSVGQSPKKVYAVRGQLTKDVLEKKGWRVPEVYGDPALLFPRIYNPNKEKKYRYGIVPHYVDYNSEENLRIINHLENLNIKVVNITSGIYNFIDELLECEMILSSSLHGLIASDAYQIPNYRVKISSEILGGDFKFLDYYSSVKRNHYLPLNLSEKTTLEDIESLKFTVGDISITDSLLENSPWNDIECEYFPNNKKLRILFLAPHLSTGGMPSYLLKRIESISQYYPFVEIFLAEFCQYSTLYTVQRDRIKSIVPEERFWTINTLDNHTVENSMKVIDIIKTHFIDIVHIDEIVEGFDSFNKVPNELKYALYDNDRNWRVVETCHNIWFDPGSSKVFHPDAYALCTPYHLEKTFKGMPSHQEVFEFPIENKFRSRVEQVRCQEELGLDVTKVHIINVGLWTSGKNQGEGIEIARHFEGGNVEFHFIGNQASNFESYWAPLMSNLPTNVKIWGERKDVELFMKASDVLMFNSTWECNPLVIREAASLGLKIIARNLPQYVGMFDGLITPLTNDVLSNVNALRRLISSTRNYNILDGMTKEFADKHYNFYRYLLTFEPKKMVKSVKSSKVSIKQFFINEPFLEIIGKSDSEYDVKFFDEWGTCHYHNKIKTNHWIKLNRKYFTKWNTKVLEDGVLIYDETLNYEGKRVLINFDSSSLGDSISWIPYVLEFKEFHKCEVIVSTHWNQLFRKVYPELEFTEPGMVVHNIHGQYNIGWYYDPKKEPVLPNTIPLQQSATNILGLPYREIKPRIHYKILERPYEEKYVTIATNSTAGCKFWTKEGWQGLINYLHSFGYKVINVSKEDNKFENCQKIMDTSMDYTMNTIHHSEFFIGLSSGLSWLSWAMNKHVVMISNFTEPDHEFTSNCTRITNPNVCNSCWNSPLNKFDKGDWNWCPNHKGTERQFECHTSITSEMVINQIQHLLR